MNDFQMAFIGLARPMGGGFGVPVEDLKEGLRILDEKYLELCGMSYQEVRRG